MKTWLNAKIGEIEDELLLELVAELEAACGVQAGPEDWLRHFLARCVYPFGTGSKRVPIANDHLLTSPWLEARIGKLPDGAIHELCRELAAGESLEFSGGEMLKTFLNRCIPKYPERTPPSETAQRKDALVHLRRRNR